VRTPFSTEFCGDLVDFIASPHSAACGNGASTYTDRVAYTARSCAARIEQQHSIFESQGALWNEEDKLKFLYSEQ
jgi:hypothetical protein